MTIKILSGGAMRPLMAQLVPRFEHAHGMTIDIEFRLTAALKHAIAAGAAFDIAVLPRPDLNDLIEQGAIAPGGAADIARSTVGLAIRPGAPKPDIGSVAALRRTLLQARSIAYSDGPSGAYVAAPDNPGLERSRAGVLPPRTSRVRDRSNPGYKRYKQTKPGGALRARRDIVPVSA